METDDGKIRFESLNGDFWKRIAIEKRHFEIKIATCIACIGISREPWRRFWEKKQRGRSRKAKLRDTQFYPKIKNSDMYENHKSLSLTIFWRVDIFKILDHGKFHCSP